MYGLTLWASYNLLKCILWRIRHASNNNSLKSNDCCPRAALNVQHAPHKYFKCPFGSAAKLDAAGQWGYEEAASRNWKPHATYMQAPWLTGALKWHWQHANFQMLDCLMHSVAGLCGARGSYISFSSCSCSWLTGWKRALINRYRCISRDFTSLA